MVLQGPQNAFRKKTLSKDTKSVILQLFITLEQGRRCPQKVNCGYFSGPHFDTTYPQQRFRRGFKKDTRKVITFWFFFGTLPREILLQIAPPDTANAEPGVWSLKSSQFGCLRGLKRCQNRSKKCIKHRTLLRIFLDGEPYLHLCYVCFNGSLSHCGYCCLSHLRAFI